MVQQTELEIVVDSSDDAVLGEVEGALAPSLVERWEPARVVDPLTVLAVAGGVVQLVNGLIALRDRLRGQSSAPTVRIRNAVGSEVLLLAATTEELRALVEGEGTSEAAASNEGGT